MAPVQHRRYVTVPATTLWASPQAPSRLDAAMVADVADVAQWLAALDAADARGGLHGRVETQLLAGEPVDVLDHMEGMSGMSATVDTVATADAGTTADAAAPGAGWVRVTCPWQPSGRDRRGYPGWLRVAHLAIVPPDGTARPPRPVGPPDPRPLSRSAARPQPLPPPWADAVGRARRHVGLPYLWGGMCDQALDCSGLVHLAMRELGAVVPRDAEDQQAACVPVPLDEALPGDLYFFARDGARAHHVGIVTGRGRMLHAPGTGRGIVEEALSPERRSTLAGAGRFPPAGVSP